MKESSTTWSVILFGGKRFIKIQVPLLSKVYQGWEKRSEGDIELIKRCKSAISNEEV